MKILLAEDDLNLGKLMSMLLKKQNILTTWVQDGQEAYNKVYTDGYDVLVLDWMMPRLSGVQLCSRLRDEDYQGKILLLTAKDTVADKVQGLNAGADDYLVKPFDCKTIENMLQKLGKALVNENPSNKAMFGNNDEDIRIQKLISDFLEHKNRDFLKENVVVDGVNLREVPVIIMNIELQDI